MGFRNLLLQRNTRMLAISNLNAADDLYQRTFWVIWLNLMVPHRFDSIRNAFMDQLLGGHYNIIKNLTS